MANPKPPQPDRKPSSASSQPPASAANRETKRPSDSVPMATGTFTKLPMQFGRYQVEKLLGRGAMGAVYLARDMQLERPVALKIPKVSASGSGKLLQRLKTEAKAAARIDHPHVCHVYDSGEIDGTPYIAMQYVEGETLKEHLEKQSKSPQEAVELVLALAEGLLEAHSQGIYHRDLKPENIKVNRRGVPVIMDFGLAKLAESLSTDAGATQRGSILGSPAYMSPEQASGKIEEVDHRSDLYSLGVILYELLTGVWPFSGLTMQVMGQKSILEPPSPLTIKPDLNPQLAAVCHKLIAKDRKDRYQSATEVRDALKAIDLSAAHAPPAGPAAQAIVSQAPVVLQEAAELASLIAREREEAASARSLPDVPRTRTPVAAAAITRQRGKRMSQIKSLPPKVWVGVAAGILLLGGLGLWASGVFTTKAKSGEGTLAREVNVSVPTKDKSEEREEEASSARPEHDGNEPVETEESRVADNTSAPEPPDAGGDDNSVTPAPTSDNVPKKEPAWPADAVAFGPKRFKLSTDHLNWHAARKKCLDLGGRLAEVRSPAENDFLVKLVTGTKVDGVWLGATDEAEEGRWLWNDGAPLSYTSWGKGQPNNVGEGGEHYLMLLVSKWSGMWWDQPATSGRGLPAGWKVGYVCEWDAAGSTEPASPAGTPHAGATVPFFNGKDLTGWAGLPGYWQVRDGAIVAAPANGVKKHTFLCSQQSYKDFEIRFRVRRKSGIGNTGVQFRSQVVDSQQYTVAGPQIEIDSAEHRKPPGSAFNEPDSKPVYASNRDVVNDIWANDDFNKMHLRCVGKRVTVKLSGILVLDVEYSSIPDEGIIAWQLNGYNSPDEVTFKDIQFADLTRGDSPLEAAAAPIAGRGDGSRPLINDQIMGRLKNAKAVYEAARDQYREGVNKHFDRREEAARKQGKKKLVDQIKAERTAFEQRGDLPLSAPAELKRKIASARSAMESAYATATRDYTKAKNDSASAAVEKELEQFRRDQDAAWVPLFNGKDTRGWHASAVVAKANWQVVGGTLVGSGEGGFLFTDRSDYQNFRLRVEAMLTEGADSGVFFRAQDERLEFAYEAEIGSVPGGNTGGFGVFDRGVKGVAPAPQPVPVGRWSTMDILAEDNRFTIWVDGTQVAQYEDKERRYSKGAIAIQQFGGPKAGVVNFRKIDIKELPSK